MATLPQATDPITELLKRSKTIAVVGLSNSPLRPSHGVAAYMQTQGYRIIPVNPEIHGALGEKAYASLADVPEKIDIVNIFRRPEAVEEIVDQAIALKVPAVWMQETVVHERAAPRLARCLHHEPRADRCVERVERVVRGGSARLGDDRKFELGSCERGGLEDRPGRRA